MILSLTKGTIQILKNGRFERMSLTANSQPIVISGSRVSCAPPDHTLPAFLKLYGRIGP